jgi:hypothetical protein
MTENALPENLLAKLQSAEELLPPLEAVLLYRLLTGKEHPRFRELQKEWRERFSPAQDSSDFALGCEVVAYYESNITGFTTLRNELAAIPKKPVPPEITASAPPVTAAPVVAPKGVREKKPPKNPPRQEPVPELSAPPVPEESATPALPLVMAVAPPVTAAPKVAKPVTEPPAPPSPKESATPASPPSVTASFIPSMTAQAKPAPPGPKTSTPPPLGRAKKLSISPVSSPTPRQPVTPPVVPRPKAGQPKMGLKTFLAQKKVNEYKAAVRAVGDFLEMTPADINIFLDYFPAQKKPIANKTQHGRVMQKWVEAYNQNFWQVANAGGIAACIKNVVYQINNPEPVRVDEPSSSRPLPRDYAPDGDSRRRVVAITR